MTKILELTNEKIYNYAIVINENIKEDLVLPIKINFYLQKNINTLTEKAQEIEKSRISICQKFGTIDEQTGNFNFEDENAEKATKELVELLNLKQDVKVYMVNLSEFLEEVNLTSKQLSAISFMINDDLENEEE